MAKRDQEDCASRSGSTHRKYVKNSVVTPSDARAPSVTEVWNQAVDEAKRKAPEASHSSAGFCKTWGSVGTAMFAMQGSTQPFSETHRDACARAKEMLVTQKPLVDKACASGDEDRADALALKVMKQVKTACGHP